MKAALWVVIDIAGFTAASMILHHVVPSADWWIVSMFALGLVWVLARWIVYEIRDIRGKR